MTTHLREVIRDAGSRKVAVGHFNVSDTVGLKAVFEAARELRVPVLIGVSEGEREFIGVRQVAALVRSFREEYDYPIFLNADHTHSPEKAKEAAEAGFDAVLFDGGALPFEENVAQTKKAVEEVRGVNAHILVEGEIGYIGSSSEVLKEVPAGAALTGDEMTSPEQAREFVERTGVDLLAPAAGNIHGIVAAPGFVERLDITRIEAIAKAVSVPLVLHGASGLSEDDLKAAIRAGVGVVHINTEIRVAWRKGIEAGLKGHPDEVAPYKIGPSAVEEIKKIVTERLKLFNGL